MLATVLYCPVDSCKLLLAIEQLKVVSCRAVDSCQLLLAFGLLTAVKLLLAVFLLTHLSVVASYRPVDSGLLLGC